MNYLRRAKLHPFLSSSRLLSRYSPPCNSPPIPSSSSSSSSLITATPKNHLFHHHLNSASFVPRRSYSFQYYYYSGRRPDAQHFRRRGPQWKQNPRAVLVVVAAGGAAALAVYYGNLEPVPYSKRKHFVLVSPAVERRLGESQFEQLKDALRGKILPPVHPDSVRVRLICREIVSALQRGLRREEGRWIDPEYASDGRGVGSRRPEEFGVDDGRAQEAVMALGAEREKGNWSREDEVLDDRWINESRKKGDVAATKHLDGLNWEVIVVQDKMVNAMCLPGGKIIVFTGLLDHFRTDAEIATVIGHEVAHAIARHGAEGITKNLGFTVLQLVLLQFVGMPDLINAMSELLLRLPFSRRMEMEADYIGLLLLASAGYDPRVAPRVYEKLGEITGDSSLRDYMSTHPSSKKRAQLLSQAGVMEEAVQIYRESIAGRGVEGFL